MSLDREPQPAGEPTPGNGAGEHVKEETHEGTWQVLKNKGFLALWVAQGLSQTAQNTVLLVLVVFIEQTTGKSVYISILMLTTFLPSLFFGIAAGVVVDRLPKKPVLLTTNLLRGVAVLGMLLTRHVLASIYLLNLAFSGVKQFWGPAELVTIPLLVPKRQLLAANGLYNLTFLASQLLGFLALGPLLIKLTSYQFLFLFIAGMYALASVSLGLLPNLDVRERRHMVAPRRAPRAALASAKSALGGMKRDIDDAWWLLSKDRVIRLAMLHLMLITTLMLGMATIAPGYVNRILRISADNAVFVFLPTGPGVLLAVWALPRLADRYPQEKIGKWALFIQSGFLLVLAIVAWQRGQVTVSEAIARESLLDPHLLWALIAIFISAFFIGLTYMAIAIPAYTMLQERAPEEMRGRIMATQLTLGSVVSILPLFFLGGIADLFGIDVVVFLVAVAVFLTGLYTHFQMRKDSGSGPDQLWVPRLSD
ncbi:MAG: MFS transporter [Chloroflexi bacterium]|nr:MFS transporter [Chloroflexota bacterium]